MKSNLIFLNVPKYLITALLTQWQAQIWTIDTSTHERFELLLVHKAELCDEVVEVFVACVHVGLLQHTHTPSCDHVERKNNRCVYLKYLVTQNDWYYLILLPDCDFFILLFFMSWLYFRIMPKQNYDDQHNMGAFPLFKLVSNFINQEIDQNCTYELLPEKQFLFLITLY